MAVDSVYVRRTYACPYCKGVFERVQLAEAEAPHWCDLCGKNVSGQKPRSKKVKRTAESGPVSRPPRPRDRNVSRGVISKAVDSTYRGMESASEQRMQEAAEVLGVDVRTLSNMKMTNMKDNLREGEMAQSTSVADAAQLVGSAPISSQAGGGAVSGLGFNPHASEYAKSTGVGVSPFAGNKARELVNSLHQAKGSRVVAAGRINKS